MVGDRFTKRCRRGAVALALPIALALSAPALAAGTFKATDHNWIVAVNAAKLHYVPSGAKFTYCASQDITAITPSISYVGARAGERYTEQVIGPAAAGTITIAGGRNVDGQLKPFTFPSSKGALGNTYAILSFPGSVHHRTLPPGTYKFDVIVGGKVVAMAALVLVLAPVADPIAPGPI